MAAEMRAEQAAILRATLRLSYAAIASRVGYHSAGACYTAMWNWYDKHHAPEGAERLRMSEGHFLDEIQQRVWPLIDGDDVDLDAVGKLLALSARRSHLMGLDAPVATGSNATQVIIAELPQAMQEGI